VHKVCAWSPSFLLLFIIKAHMNIRYIFLRRLKVIFILFKIQTSITKAPHSLPTESSSERASGIPRSSSTTKATESLGIPYMIFGAATSPQRYRGEFYSNKISGVGTNFGPQVHVLPGPNKRRACKSSMF
jgi:hypothetical protein